MNKKTIFLIGVLATITGILISYRLLNKKSSSFPIPTPSPTPSFPVKATPTLNEPANIIEEQEQTIKNYYPLIDKTPYRTVLFELTYSDPLKLKVTMFGKNKEEIKSKVEEFLKENGIDPNSHIIEFVRPTPFTTPAP